MKGIDNGRGCGSLEGDGVYRNSVLSLQFFCESKTSLRNKAY